MSSLDEGVADRAQHTPPVVEVRHRRGQAPRLMLDPVWRDRVSAEDLPELIEQAFAQLYASEGCGITLTVEDDWASQLADLLTEPPRRGLPHARFGSDLSGWLRLEVSPSMRVIGVDADPAWLNRRDPLAIATAFDDAYEQASQSPWSEVW